MLGTRIIQILRSITSCKPCSQAQHSIDTSNPEWCSTHKGRSPVIQPTCLAQHSSTALHCHRQRQPVCIQSNSTKATQQASSLRHQQHHQCRNFAAAQGPCHAIHQCGADWRTGQPPRQLQRPRCMRHCVRAGVEHQELWPLASLQAEVGAQRTMSCDIKGELATNGMQKGARCTLHMEMLATVAPQLAAQVQRCCTLALWHRFLMTKLAAAAVANL